MTITHDDYPPRMAVPWLGIAISVAIWALIGGIIVAALALC